MIDEAKINLTCTCADFVKDVLSNAGIDWRDEDVRTVSEAFEDDEIEYGAQISFPSPRFRELSDFIRVAGQMMAAAPNYCEMRFDLASADNKVKAGAVACYGRLQPYCTIDAVGIAAEKAEKIKHAAKLLREVLSE